MSKLDQYGSSGSFVDGVFTSWEQQGGVKVPSGSLSDDERTELKGRITELEAALEQGELLELETDYTVSGLQKIAASLGLEDAGNKGELAARIRAAQEVSSDPVTDATG